MGLSQFLQGLTPSFWRADPLPVWHHSSYRLPIHDIGETFGLEPRRADLALWALQAAGNSGRLRVMTPTRASYVQMATVHDSAYLESLTRPLELSRIFGLNSADIPVDHILNTIRLAVGGTIAAARYARSHGVPTLNLLGGFHHAFPDKGGGLCPINDIGVALEVLRQDGFQGNTLILDLDAHPPDGIAACHGSDPKVHIASISGSDWGPMEGVDEVLLPEQSTNSTYLKALKELLKRVPKVQMAFVIAGGDVMAHDNFGKLALDQAGVQQRDEMVLEFLGDIPSVWVPGGGYRADAWKVLAQTAGVLMGGSRRPIRFSGDPMRAHYERTARRIDPYDLSGSNGEALFSQDEIDAFFGSAPKGPPKFLDYYTTEGIEYALYRYGLLDQLRTLGYDAFDVEIDQTPPWDRFRLYGEGEGAHHLLVESVIKKTRLEGHRLLYLNWLTMRHPLGEFAIKRPRLPGQEYPGLGMAWEAGQIMRIMAKRLELEGVMHRPSWFHTAFFSKAHGQFLTIKREADFRAVYRDLAHLGLAKLTQAIHEGKVLRNGAPYTWGADPMIAWLDGRRHDGRELHLTMQDVRFTLRRSAFDEAEEGGARPFPQSPSDEEADDA